MGSWPLGFLLGSSLLVLAVLTPAVVALIQAAHHICAKAIAQLCPFHPNSPSLPDMLWTWLSSGYLLDLNTSKHNSISPPQRVPPHLCDHTSSVWLFNRSPGEAQGLTSDARKPDLFPRGHGLSLPTRAPSTAAAASLRLSCLTTWFPLPQLCVGSLAQISSPGLLWVWAQLPWILSGPHIDLA